MSISPVLVSVTEAAAALGIGTTKTKALIARGELRSVTIDRRRLVPVDGLHDYVLGLTEGPEGGTGAATGEEGAPARDLSRVSTTGADALAQVAITRTSEGES